MGRTTKIVAWLIAAFFAVFALAAIFFVLFFDPNDFRDDIAGAVKERTGRDLVIEGDLSVAFFPWLAIEVGHTTLGNAPGFGEEPFAEFDQAKLSVRLLPMLLRQEVAIGTAELKALTLNLEVDPKGRSNWDDLLADRGPAKAEAEPGEGKAVEVSGIDVSDTTIRYRDRQSGDTYVLSGMTMQFGRVSDDGRPVPASGAFHFEMQPGKISGDIEMDTALSFDLKKSLVTLDGLTIEGVVAGITTSPTSLKFETDGIEVQTDKQLVTVQPLAMSLLGIDIEADVEPFSYAAAVEPVATVKTDAFSPRSVMHLLDIEVPETADPVALSRVIVDAKAAVRKNAVEMSGVTIKLDDTTFKGALTVPRSKSGAYRFDLGVDRIDLNRYMAPADTAAPAAGGESVPVEIPADLIRPLNARGNLRVATALLGGMEFQDVELGLNSANGRLRIHPVTAKLYGGSYSGDVRVDVSGQTPVLSVDEKIQNVNLADMTRALFKKENVTGTVNGGFVLSGRGDDMAAVQKSLGGNMSFELIDGSYEGTDIWYELRRARALLKGGAAPKPTLPPRTQFSSVSATGVVSNGVMRNDDLSAELPFMQITGRGTVDLPAATVNYDLTARVLERPESLKNVTEEELEDFTKAVIPLKITGPLTSPSVKPNVEALLKKRVEEEIKSRVFDKLLGGDRKTAPPPTEPKADAPAEGAAEKAAPAEGAAEEAVPAEEPPPEQSEKEKLEEEVKDKLKDLFGR
jgi:AsmA protein